MRKFKKIISLITTYIFIVTMISSNINYKVLASTLSDTESQLEAIEGQVVIKIKNLDDTSYKSIIDNYQGKELDTYENYLLIELDDSKINDFTNEINTNENIEYAEVNAIGEKSTVDLDELAIDQDYLFNTNAIEAWGLVTDEMKKTEIKVAIIDSGIKSTHQDLVGKVDTDNGYNFVSNNNNTDDDNGHGTNMAGVIAANHNGVGINGIAGQVNAKLIPIKVLDENGVGTTLNIAKGIKYAADKGISLINISINGKGFSKVIDDSIKYALSKGVLVVASAGNQGEYAENYWPCNSEGVVVVGNNVLGKDLSEDSIYTSNIGDRIDIDVESQGLSTGINIEGYEKVGGTSISSAIVTATIALVKARNTKLTNDELKSIIKNSVVSGGRIENAEGLSIKEAISTKNGFIEIISPISAKELSNDVIVDLLALKPSEIATVKYYLNGDNNPYSTLNGNGSENYQATLKYEDLINGINKVEVVATDNMGEIYSEERYFKSSSNSTTLTISIKDKLGNPYKNLMVKCGDSMEVLTDENGEAQFLNIDPSKMNNIVITSENVDSLENIYYSTNIVGAGKRVIDFSTSSKEIKINALKSDNKAPLSDAEVRLGTTQLGTDFKLDSTGNITLITNNTGNLKLAISSQEEGYLYIGDLDLSNTSSKTFGYDDTISEVDYTNLYDSKIGTEKLLLSTSDNLYYGLEFNIKNRPMYITKGEYNFEYSFSDLNNTVTTNYFMNKQKISENKNINFIKPEIAIEKFSDELYRLKLTNNEYEGEMSKDTKLDFDVIDYNGNKLELNKDYVISHDEYSDSNYIEDFNIELINKPKGLYKFKVIIPYYDENIESQYYTIDHIGNRDLELNYTIDNIGNSNIELQNKTVNLKFNLPTDLLEVIYDKKDIIGVKYEIYDKDNKNIITEEEKWIQYNDINNFKFELPDGLDGLNNNIYVTVTSKYGGVILDRYLEKAINSDIVLDCNTNNVKKISIRNNSGLNIDKSTFKINKVGRDDSNFSLIQYVKNINDLKFWVDKNSNYELSVYNDKLFLINEGVINDTNSSIDISNNFGKVKFNYQQDSYIKRVSLELTNNNNNNKVYTMPETNIKNELIISSGYKLSNVRYTFKSISNWILGEGVDSEYRFSTEYDILKDSSKIIDLTNLKLQYTSAPQSVNYDGEANIGISLSNSDLKLIDYRNGVNTEQNNNEEINDRENTVSFYNENGKLIKKLEVETMTMENINLSNVNANPGIYTAKFDLIGLKANNLGFNITVLENNIIKLRIMDPFDITKPLEDAVIKVGEEGIGGREYKTDKDGYVVINRYDLNENYPIIVITSKEGVPIIFKTPNNIYDKNETISVPISEIQLVNIKPKDYKGKVSIANNQVEVRDNYNWIFTSVLLDENGYGKLYTNVILDKLIIRGEHFTLSSSYKGTGDIIFDNVNLGSININSGDSYINNAWFTNSKTGDEFFINRSGIYYLTPGNYSYVYYKNLYTYHGNIDVVNGATKILQFGENVTNIITTSKSNIEVGEEVVIKVESKDEYGNKVTYNSGNIDLIVTQNGIEVERSKDIYSYEDGTYRCMLDTISENFNVKLEITDNNDNKVIITNELAFSMNLNKYKKISVKAPNGDYVTSGKLIKTSGYKTREIPISAGTTYVDENYLLEVSNYNVFGKTNNNEYVLYGDIKIDNTTTEIKGASLNKTKFNIVSPENNASGIRFEISKKKSDIEDYSMNIISEYYYGDLSNNDSFIEEYNNKNIYIDGSEFFIKSYYYNYDNDDNNSYLLAQIANNKTVNINLDSNNVSKVTLENLEGYTGNSVELRTSWATFNINNSDYVSKDVFDSYKFYVSKNDSSNYQSYNYSKQLTTPINSDNYIIKYGEPSKLVAETKDNLILNKDSYVTSKLYIYDGYENKIDIGYGSSGYMNITVDGKKLEKRYVYGSMNDGYLEINERLGLFGKNIDISYSMDVNGKLIESDSIRYTMDLSKYKAISVKDPLGQPLVSGGTTNYYDYKIIDGYLYIDNETVNNYDNSYTIVGVNSKGDRVVYENYYINKDTKEIKDTTLASYTVNLDKFSFGNAQSIKYNLINKNNYYGSYIDNFQENGDEIKTSFKYFIKENNYDIAVEVSTDDNIYLSSSKIGKDYSSCNIVNNATLNVNYKSAKYRIDNLYYSLDNSVYSYDNILDINKKIFVAPNTFYINKAHITEIYENGSSSQDIVIKDSFVGNEDKTILIGSEELYNFRVNDVLYLDRYNSLLKENYIIDEYGNKLSDYYGGYTVKYISDGYVSEEVYGDSLPSNIKEGIYTVEITINRSSLKEPIKIVQENVRVISSNNILYENYGKYGSYKLFKSGIEVDSNFNKVGGVNILTNPKIIEGRDYRLAYFNVNKEYYYDSPMSYNIYHRNEIAYVSSGTLYPDYNYTEISTYKISNAKVVSVYGPDGLKIENIDIENYDLNLHLIKGQTYTVEALIDDGTGVALVKKTFVANNTLENSIDINFDKTSLKKVTIDNGIKGKSNINNLNLTDSDGKKFSLNEKIDIAKGLYLPSGIYDITMDVVNYDLGVIKYKKNVQVASNDVTIQIGKNIVYEVGVDKELYNTNEEIQGVVNNFTDKDAVNGYLIDNKLKNIKIDLMHGDSIVTSFSNMLPESLKGECIIRVNGLNDLLGEISSKNIFINVDNPEDILVGDINLDEYVDIFDLVYISRDMDKEKGIDSSFDPRVNLDASNNKIDIADLAKAAMNYSN